MIFLHSNCHIPNFHKEFMPDDEDNVGITGKKAGQLKKFNPHVIIH